jgi:hypothetical protein
MTLMTVSVLAVLGTGARIGIVTYERWTWSQGTSTKVYFVGDLVPNMQDHPDFDALITEIEGTIARESWASAGGKGTIQVFQPNLSLVVTQCEAVHARLSRTLTRWRQEGVRIKPSKVRQSSP